MIANPGTIMNTIGRIPNKLALLALMSISPHLFAQAEFIAFDSERWTMINAKQMDHLGRKALMGTAFLKDVEFGDGIIELDMAVERKTSYPGVLFRMKSLQEYERFYIRPHRAGLYADAIQYVASFNGVDSWQLYSGPGTTAALEVPYGTWFHVKLEVKGSQARIFINNSDQPSLVITELQRGAGKGMIGLMGPTDGSSFYSNFRYRADEDLNFPPLPAIEYPLGLITDWEISQVFKANEVDLEATPEAQGLDTVRWQAVKALPNGIVDVSRFHGRKGADADCIFARTIIESEKDETKQFAFGYSDAITIFLNGNVLFGANSAYRQRDPSFLGIVGLNDYLYLQLRKGKNELMLIVAEMSGGWGFIFQDANAVFESPSLKKIWELPRRLKYPESVVYDGKRNVLYVSNYYNGGNEFISKLSVDGKVEKRAWVTGLRQPTGLCLDGAYLYAVDRRNLCKIDIDSAKVVATYPIPGAVFPNDVAAGEAGHLYITDSQRNAILMFRDGDITTFLEGPQLSGVNGILHDDGKLVVGVTGDASVKQIDLASKEITVLAQLESGSVMDGLQKDEGGNYLFSDYNGRIFRLHRSGKLEKLLNTKAPQRFCADFEYIPERRLLIIPSLFDNRIVAYEMLRE